jgi:predicted small secreted protein
MMRKFVLFAALAASLAVAACNTIEGAGRDISAAGGAIADTARDAKR